MGVMGRDVRGQILASWCSASAMTVEACSAASSSARGAASWGRKIIPCARSASIFSSANSS